MRRHRALALGVVITSMLVSGVAAGIAPVAMAHARVVSVTPSDGQVLPVGPTAVVVAFSERVTVDPGNVQLLDGAGSIVVSRVTVDDSTAGTRIRIVPAARLNPGRFAARWSVSSADGHVVVGASAFAVGRPGRLPAGARVVLLPAPGVPASWATGPSGQGLLTVAGKATSGSVTLTHPLLGAPLVWELARSARQLVGRGLLPFPGRWKAVVVLRDSAFAERVLTGVLVSR